MSKLLAPEEAAELADEIYEQENTSGYIPLEFKILVEPDEVEERTASGLYLATQVTEREKQKQVRGRLVAVGGNAFQDWSEPIPQVGDMVCFAKFAGYVMPGSDGREYRLIHDKDLVAIRK